MAEILWKKITIVEMSVQLQLYRNTNYFAKKNIRARKELEREIFSDYWCEEGRFSVSQMIIKEFEQDMVVNEQEDDEEMFDGSDMESYDFKSDREESDQDEEGEDFGASALENPSDLRRSERLRNARI